MKRRGYFMHYHDIPICEMVKNCNFKNLEIQRDKRHYDLNVKQQFWSDLEWFLLKPQQPP